MADIPAKIIRNAAPHLEPGETALVAFPGQTKPMWWMIAGAVLFVVFNRYRSIVITDRRILVFDSGRWSTAKATTLIRELPRSTTIGPAEGMWYTTDALGETLHVHLRFHDEIAAADAA